MSVQLSLLFLCYRQGWTWSFKMTFLVFTYVCCVSWMNLIRGQVLVMKSTSSTQSHPGLFLTFPAQRRSNQLHSAMFTHRDDHHCFSFVWFFSPGGRVLPAQDRHPNPSQMENFCFLPLIALFQMCKRDKICSSAARALRVRSVLQWRMITVSFITPVDEH